MEVETCNTNSTRSLTLDKSGGGNKLGVTISGQDNLVVGLCPPAPGIHDAFQDKYMTVE